MFVPKILLFPLFYWFVKFTLTDKHGTKNLLGLIRPCMFSSVQFSSVQFSSVQFSSVQFSSVQFSSVQFSSVQFSSFISPYSHTYMHLRGQIAGAIYSGFGFVVRRLCQNVSAYRPDCLFETVTSFWEVTPVNHVILRTYRTNHG